MRRLERLLAIALFLGARKRVRASEAADRFGVSLRTIYRDTQALVEAGFPVEGNAGDGLVCRGDAWWLVAWCRLRRDARAFRVDRVSEWRTAGSFPPREGLSFDEIVQRDRHLAQDLFGY